MSRPKRGTHPGEVVYQGQNPKPRTVEELIVHPIHRPAIVGCHRRRPIIPKLCHDPSPRWFVSHLQPFQPVKPVHTRLACRPAFPAQQDMDSPIAVSDMRLCDLPDAFAKQGLLRASRSIQIHRSMKVQHAAGPSRTDTEDGADMIHQLPFLSRPQTFYRKTSWSISLSRLRSDTSRRGRAFSSSRCFSLRTSEGIRPP